MISGISNPDCTNAAVFAGDFNLNAVFVSPTIWVGGVLVTRDNIDRLANEPGISGGVTYTPAVGTIGKAGYIPQTLTLTNARITGAYKDSDNSKYGIYADKPLNIVISGNNYIGGDALNAEESQDSSSYAICKRGELLQISGNSKADKLTLVAGTAAGDSAGIYAEDTTIRNVSVISTGGTAVQDSYGINANIGKVIIDNAVVSATSGLSTGTPPQNESYYSIGIFADLGLLVSGDSLVTASSLDEGGKALLYIKGVASIDAEGFYIRGGSSAEDAGDVSGSYSAYRYLIVTKTPLAPPAPEIFYYRLSFETNGGKAIRRILRQELVEIKLKKYVPTREGYEFDGWYADEELTQRITSVWLTENTTIYAGWRQSESPDYLS